MEILLPSRIGHTSLFSVTKGPHPDEVKRLNEATIAYKNTKDAPVTMREKDVHASVMNKYNELLEMGRAEVRQFARVTVFDRSLLNIPLPTTRPLVA